MSRREIDFWLDMAFDVSIVIGGVMLIVWATSR